MAITMFHQSIPVFVHSLKSLAGILQKAAAHADQQELDEKVFVTARLFPDMFPLSRQVQIASDLASRGAARLCGVEPPQSEDKETTFAELQIRIQSAVEFIETLDESRLEGAEARTIKFKAGGEEVSMSGEAYLNYFILPNVYFHITTAYNILRHNGVKLGKRDYLGR